MSATAESAAPARDPQAPTHTHGSGYAALVAAGIFLSRIAGFVRERAFAHYFGATSIAAGVVRAGFRIPNFLQNLFGEGVLSASFIPVYARLLAEGEEELAGRVAGAIAALLALFIGVLVLLGVLATPYLIDLIVPGFEGASRQLTIHVVRIVFPACGLLVLSAWCLGVLNSHRKFFLSYVAPVAWNGTLVATLLIFGRRLGLSSLAVAFAWGSVDGALLQIAVQVPFVLRHARTLRFSLAAHLAPVREVLVNTVPVVIGRGAVQVSSYVDTIIASFLGAAALKTAAVALLGYSQTLYLLPISLFGMSVAAAELPQMSGTRGTSEEIASALRRRLTGGLRQIAFFVVPTVVGYLLIGKTLVAALYQTGHFGAADSLYVWYVLAGASLGLLAVTRGRLFNSAYYALHDTVTPLRYALVRIALTAVLGFLFAFPLRPWLIALAATLGLPVPDAAHAAVVFGAAGLTTSAGLAGWVEYLLLRRGMERRIGTVHVAVSTHLSWWAAALPAGGLAWLTDRYLLPRFTATASLPPTLARFAEAGAVLTIFGGTYLALTTALGLPEARSLWRRILRRRSHS